MSNVIRFRPIEFSKLTGPKSYSIVKNYTQLHTVDALYTVAKRLEVKSYVVSKRSRSLLFTPQIN